MYFRINLSHERPLLQESVSSANMGLIVKMKLMLRTKLEHNWRDRSDGLSAAS
jgi:hypothetical protein